jgi:hypothetical protein
MALSSPAAAAIPTRWVDGITVGRGVNVKVGQEGWVSDEWKTDNRPLMIDGER